MKVTKIEPNGSVQLRKLCLERQTDITNLQKMVDEAYASPDVPKDGSLVVFPDFVIRNSAELKMLRLEMLTMEGWISIDAWIDEPFYTVEE